LNVAVWIGIPVLFWVAVAFLVAYLLGAF